MFCRVLLHDKCGLSHNIKVTNFCEELYNSGNRSPFLLALIVDMCSEQVSQSTDDPRYNVERAKSLCSELAEKYDTVRAKYWNYMAESVEKNVKKEESQVEAEQ